MYTKARAEGKFDHLRPLKMEREKFRCFPDVVKRKKKKVFWCCDKFVRQCGYV